MQNKFSLLFVAMFAAVSMSGARAADDVDAEKDELSAAAVADYRVEGSLFQQITDLEQEKVLMQLEKERAQLDLELDRLAAEKIRLHMEIDTLSGRAEAQQQEIETEKAKLEAEAARLAREKEALENAAETAPRKVSVAASANDAAGVDLTEQYRLVNVIGAGAQLQATVEDLNTGQNKKVSVGKTLDGYTVKSISLDDGVVLESDGDIQTLNISSNR